MRSKRGAVVGLAVVLVSAGCGSYRPYRAPRADLLHADPVQHQPIRMSIIEQDTAVQRADHEGLAVSMQIIDRGRSQRMFGRDLPARGIQPVYFAVENTGGGPYHIRKSAIDRRYIPAARVARRVSPPAALTALRDARWAVLVGPGLLLESVIEPALTMDFPGLEDAVRRPTPPNTATLVSRFVATELVDGPLPPGERRAGIVFVRPLPMGRPFVVTLIDGQTGAAVPVSVPMPEPIVRVARRYAAPSDRVWRAAVDASRSLQTWRITAADPSTRTLTVRHGAWLPGVRRATQTTVRVQPLADRRTHVRIESTPPRGDTRAIGTYSRTIDQFFASLEEVLGPQDSRRVARPARAISVDARATPADADAHPATEEPSSPPSS